jgi:hypothetical protein
VHFKLESRSDRHLRAANFPLGLSRNLLPEEL